MELEMVVKAQEELRVERDRAKLKPGSQTQRSPEGPRHLHRIPRLSEAPWEVP